MQSPSFILHFSGGCGCWTYSLFVSKEAFEARLFYCLRNSYVYIIYFDKIHLPFPPPQFFPYFSHHIFLSTLCAALFYKTLETFGNVCFCMSVGKSTRVRVTSQRPHSQENRLFPYPTINCHGPSAGGGNSWAPSLWMTLFGWLDFMQVLGIQSQLLWVNVCNCLVIFRKHCRCLLPLVLTSSLSCPLFHNDAWVLGRRVWYKCPI